MVDDARARKVAHRIQQVAAEVLQTKLQDPGLGFITITDCRVTGDLQHATLYYTAFDRRGTAKKALQRAVGPVRSAVGRALGIRLTPTITFVEDELLDHAQTIEEAVRRARAEDERIASQAASAQYAAGEDPYVHDEDAEDDSAAGEL